MTTKYCQCGQPIGVDYRWNGLVHRIVLSDTETGDEITHCPGCGESVTATRSASELLNEPPIDANICGICGGEEELR